MLERSRIQKLAIRNLQRLKNPDSEEAKSQKLRAKSSYCINSAGLPVRRSMRFAIGGWVENRLPKFIPRNG